MKQLKQFIDYNFTVICRCCGGKVMDPDKKKGQTHLKGKCPSCGKDSKEEKKSKKERKKEKREAREREKAAAAACRGKY